MILGRKRSFWPDFDPEISIFIVAYPPLCASLCHGFREHVVNVKGGRASGEDGFRDLEREAH